VTRTGGETGLNGLLPRWLTICGMLCCALSAKAEITGPSFDCRKATADIEKLICADEELARLDRELAAAYRIARHFKNVDRASQTTWIRRRDSTCVARPLPDCRAIIEAQIIELRASAINGVWGPGPVSLEVRGNLTVRKGTISWKGCNAVPYRILGYQRADSYPGDPMKGRTTAENGPFEVVLLLVAESSCFKNERYIQFAIPVERRVHANIITYESPEQFEKGYYSWAGFGRRDLP
jgi:hypothetical protein